MSLLENNEKTVTELLRRIAKKYKEILLATIKELKLESFIPKDINFFDSIVFIERDGRIYVGSALDYSWNIENGRQRGSHVPVQPLKEWLIYKLGMEEKKAHRVAYAVERKIFKDGIRARRPFRISVYKLKEFVESG